MAENSERFKTPISSEAERNVLGSILISGNEAVRKINHLIKPEDFYHKINQVIFKACLDLYQEGIEVDLLTLSDVLQDSGWLDSVGGSSGLSEITNDVISSVRVVQYAKIIAKYSNLRRILGAANDISRMTQNYGGDMDKLLIDAEKRLQGVTREAARQQDKLEMADLQDFMTLAREHREPEGTVHGLSSGLFKVDKMTQGFVPGELMIISGQTSHGKTQLSNNIMLKVAQADKKVMFVTLEMTKRETGERFNMLTADQDIGHGKIYLNMRPDLTHTDVTKLIERAKERGCEMVVIDHLHYFSRSIENATQEVSKIVKEFKGAAVKYEMPVILICHVRKMPPKKHPTLEDLRDSSLIAQDADIVLMVWRDESPNATNPDEVEVVLWKNRNRQKKHRRDYLYADSMKLVEVDPRPESVKQQQQHENTEKMLGESNPGLIQIEDINAADLDF